MPTKSHGLWRTWQGSTERPRLNPKIGFKGPVGKICLPKTAASHHEEAWTGKKSLLEEVEAARMQDATLPPVAHAWVSPDGTIHDVDDEQLYEFCKSRQLHY